MFIVISFTAKLGHGLCFYSGVRMKLSEAHLDHIYPKSINPKLTSEESNLCFCHGAINMAKNDTDPVKFLRVRISIQLHGLVKVNLFVLSSSIR